MYSKIIKNANIIDGTGAKATLGDIAIEQDKIVQVGVLKKAKAQEYIDAEGKFVAPGFVDVQNHSDVYWTLFENPSSDGMLLQGITSVLVGNCGASLAPLLSREALLVAQKWRSLSGVNFSWLSFAEFLQVLDQKKLGVNVGSLVGYSTLRRGLIKDSIRGLSKDEVFVIERALRESLQQGAFGLSTGLAYAHEAIIAETELLQLCRIVREYSGLLSVHLRSESAELTESVAEALELINQTDVNLKISHFKAKGKSNWHLLPHALNLIEANYQRKGKVLFDVYPYDTMWSVLYTYLPRWSYEGGREQMLRHLKDPAQRKKITAYLLSRDVNYSEIFIASTTMPLNISGKTIGEIAARQNISSEEALLNVLEHGGSEVLAYDRNLDQEQVDDLAMHPLSIIATDGAGFGFEIQNQLVHPRCFGTMPKFLASVMQSGKSTLEQAVRKITSTPAEKIGFAHRGKIAPNYFADLVIFDASINSSASYANPYQKPTGIDKVFVNGKLVVSGSKLTGDFAGYVLRRK